MFKFSIITSAHIWNKHRANQLHRCNNSIKSLLYKKFEWILVDDGSTEKFPRFDRKNVTTVEQSHLERVHALRAGMEVAAGDWFVFLDSDDELFTYSLNVMDEMTQKHPNYKMFNFASYHVHRGYGAHIRSPFQPEKLDVGHEIFGGGNIVNGTYIFHRSVFEDLGGYPKDIENVDTTELNYGAMRDLRMTSPYDFSAAAQLEFPEIRQFFTVSNEEPVGKTLKELGNPWGQDFYLFYKYTRKYHSLPVNVPLYIVHHEEKTIEGAHVL